MFSKCRNILKITVFLELTMAMIKSLIDRWATIRVLISETCILFFSQILNVLRILS